MTGARGRKLHPAPRRTSVSSPKQSASGIRFRNAPASAAEQTAVAASGGGSAGADALRHSAAQRGSLHQPGHEDPRFQRARVRKDVMEAANACSRGPGPGCCRNEDV